MKDGCRAALGGKQLEPAIGRGRKIHAAADAFLQRLPGLPAKVEP
jgi:hypothetical protein